jgi:hypothetical protein
MSFSVMAWWQALLLLAAAAAAAVWLFRMKIRPPRVGVPTLFLWRRVLDEKREMTWWERVRWAVSLAATVLIAVALALAVTRPGPRRSADASRGRRLIVLDSSWSMLARTESGGTRWDRAVRLAHRLAAASGGADVALATTADGLVEGPSADTALIETAIDRVRPSGGESAPWPVVAGVDAVHFITDGAVARSLDTGVTIHSVFEAAPNVAVTAFDARPAAAGAKAPEAFVAIANYAPAAQKVRLTITRDSTMIAERTVDLGPGEAGYQAFPIASGKGGRLLARVSAPQNALDVDDEASAWLPGGEPIAVTIVADEPAAALARLLKDAPWVTPTFVTPAQYRQGRADVFIFDRWAPPAPPNRPALLLAPPPVSWLGTAGADEKAPHWIQPGNHPVLDGVDPLTLDIKRARGLQAPGLTVVAQSEKGTPLVLVADAVDRRLIALSFAVADSNLAFAHAFPVLIGNALEWLAQPSFGPSRRPGRVTLPGSTLRVTDHSGNTMPLVRAGGFAVATLGTPGLHLVEAGGARGVVAVNVGDPEVSNLGRSSLAGKGQPSDAASSGGGRPWWTFAVIGAFLLASIEWWTWQRRVTV